MLSILLLGLLGGFITGISPCILPVLPILFLTGADSARTFTALPGVGASPARKVSKWRPYQVVAGLVLSFSFFTLLGTLILNSLGLPQGILRAAGILLLILVGLGMILPRLEELLEKPFSKLPTRNINTQRGGFLMGLALGLVYVPCAGPVLAAITVAGATGNIGLETVVLTLSFAAGTALPLLFFALAGRGLTERLKGFRRRQRAVRVTAGVLLIALAAGLALDVPAQLQRLLPNYTASLEEQVGQAAQEQLSPGNLAGCQDGLAQLQDCGAAPELEGINGWINSEPLTLANQKGKVTLLDFWAYSCINCQRATPHIQGWYQKYKDYGLQVVGVHTPEYAFEHETENVRAGAQKLGISYPVAQDNDYRTWRAYNNHYWPAHYLIDAEGKLRAIKYGEGGYEVTEEQIRQLLQAANPGVELPEAGGVQEAKSAGHRSPETYLGVGRAKYYEGSGNYQAGPQLFELARPSLGRYSLGGNWFLTDQYIEAGQDAVLQINYRALSMQLVAQGSGQLTVLGDEASGLGQKTLDLPDTPNAVTVLEGDQVTSGTLTIKVPAGVRLYSATFS